MKPIDLSKLKTYPLAQRKSMATIEETLIDPASSVPKPFLIQPGSTLHGVQPISVPRARPVPV